MKKNIALFTLLILSLISVRLSAQSPEEMKAFTEYMTPGPIQQMMAKSTGAWSAVVTMWTQESAPPTTYAMETSYDMILGGRYMRESDKGTMFNMPFEGIGVTGYDNAKKMFVSSWVDNMGTGIIFLEGTWYAASSSINYNGKSTDPLTKRDIPTRETVKFVDDNHQVTEMYFTEKGKEFKGMEIKYTRK